MFNCNNKYFSSPKHQRKLIYGWVHSSEYEIAANYDFECYSEGDSDSEDYVSGIWVALKLKNKS